MSRVYNFSAGPAVLPEEVLREGQEEMMDYRGCGMSVMEMSHRSSMFQDIIDETEADFRKVLGVPSDYKVFFAQGGGWLQFAMVPMNFMRGGRADYIITGQWAKKAFEEAGRFGDAAAIASSEDKGFTYIPDCSNLPVREGSKYVYICENNTIYGTKYHFVPDTHGVPLIADMSSCFLSEPVDVKRYAMIWGGVQKNVGPAGLVIGCVREDMLPDGDLPGVPTMMQYRTYTEHGSMFNTPNCYAIYICGKVFKWLLGMGGLEVMKARNLEKAALLYDYLDSSRLFRGTVRKEDRSLMNVPFVTGDKELDARFVSEAAAAGLVNLKGHRTAGGMRASIYNAMPKAGVEKLVQFMEDFEKKNMK